jgi:membrane protease YdiL (CAAX protease family)
VSSQTAPTARPPSLPRSRVARWRPSAAVAAIAIALVASQLAAGGLVLAAGGDHAPDAVGAGALVVADLVILSVVVLFARRGAERLTRATLGVRRTRLWPAVGWMLAIYFGVVATQALWLIVMAATGAVGGGGHDATTHLATPVALLVLLGAAVTAPIVEEISFRGYLFPALTRWRGPWLAAVITALLFGAAHALVYPPLLLPLMVAFGFGACLLFWFTGSLLPGIALHALNNALVVSIAIGLGWLTPLAMVACVAVSLGVLMPFTREPRATRSPLLDRHPSPVAEDGHRRNRATAALVLGIIALLASLFAPLAGWVLAAFAVTFGAKGRAQARGGDGRATAGIVLGIVAILLGVAQIVLAAALL